MSVFRVRNRLVNFRVTDEEYERLRSASLASGARSLSDFARAAVLRAAARHPRGERSEPASASLALRVAELETALRNFVRTERSRQQPEAPLARSLPKRCMEEP